MESRQQARNFAELYVVMRTDTMKAAEPFRASEHLCREAQQGSSSIEFLDRATSTSCQCIEGQVSSIGQIATYCVLPEPTSRLGPVGFAVGVVAMVRTALPLAAEEGVDRPGTYLHAARSIIAEVHRDSRFAASDPRSCIADRCAF